MSNSHKSLASAAPLILIALAIAYPPPLASQPPEVTGEALERIDETGWQEVDRGAYSKRFRKTIRFKNPDTGDIKETHRQYTALGNGLHYWDNGQWRESQSLIEVGQGGAVARHGPLEVIFSANAGANVLIDFMTSDDQRFQSRVVGLYYFDAASGDSVQLAPIRNSQGRVLPPNQALYPDAFKGIEADLLYTYTRSLFQQDVVLLEQPPPPGQFGLDPATTRFEVWTEFLDAPAPEKRRVVLEHEPDPEKREQMVEPELVDEILFFGDSWFPVGTAFRFDHRQADEPGEPARVELRSPSDPNVLPVGKQWTEIDGRTMLIESVDYNGLLNEMEDFGQAELPDDIRQKKKRVAQGRTLPKKASDAWSNRPLMVAQNQPLKVAQNQSYRPEGFVLDYTVESGTAVSYTFTNGRTFVITNTFTVGSGEATFEPGCVIKYASFGAELKVSGTYSFPDTQQTPVFTAGGDESYGEDITSGETDPAFMASPALWHYFVPDSTIRNARFRWAFTDILYDVDECDPHTNHVERSRFEHSQTGIDTGDETNDVFVLNNLKYCDVTYPTSGSGTIQGSITDALLCAGKSFEGINLIDDAKFEPPDTMGDIGPNHFVEITNEKMVAFSRTNGMRLDEIKTDEFFGITDTNNRAFDPRLIYDHLSQRWLACAIDDNADDICLAVSDDNDPTSLTTSSSDWDLYTFNVATNGWETDFATLGVDANGIYICNAHWDSGFQGNTVMATKKPEIYQGQRITTRHFVQLSDVETEAIQPALNWESNPNGDKAWFVAKGPPGDSPDYKGGNLFYRSMTWNSNTTSFEWNASWQEMPTDSNHREYFDWDSVQTSNKEISEPPQKDASTDFRLWVTGSRAMNAFVQDDPDSDSEFLWTSQHIGLAGTNFLYDGDSSGSGVDRSAIQWIKTEIDSNGDLLASTMDFDRIHDDTDTSTPYWYYFPSLAVNVNGTMVMGFSGSEANEYIGAFYTARFDDGTTLDRPTLIEAGRDSYTRNWWGDYSATRLDPGGTNFWTAQEHALFNPPQEDPVSTDLVDGEFWGTWIQEIEPNR